MTGQDPVLTRIEPRVQRQQALLIEQVALSAKQIHDLRITTKQIRACLRLYRPFIEGDVLRQADQITKQIADAFAGLRDSHVQIKTLNKLLRGKPHVMLQLQPLYDWLQRGKSENLQPDPVNISRLFDQLLMLWKQSLVVDQSRWWREGARKTYRRARKQGAKAIESQIDDDFHRWRKWVKYWMYQVNFLASVQDSAWAEHPQQLKCLGDALGVFQDLCVLESTIIAQAQRIEDPSLAPWLLNRIMQQKVHLKNVFADRHSQLFGARGKQLSALLETMPDE